jgi:hypothetical protein
MEYRGVEFSGSRPDVWKWHMLVGEPEMLRMGEASSEHRAVAEVDS